MIGWKVRVGGDFKAGGKDDGVGAESLGRLSKETQTQKRTVQGDKKHTHTDEKTHTEEDRKRQKETEKSQGKKTQWNTQVWQITHTSSRMWDKRGLA